MSQRNIKINNLTFGYTERRLFQNLCLTLAHDINLIRGPSGCGKTTLLKLIGNFLPLPDYPEHISGMPVKPVLILQEDGLWPWLSGIDNIKYVLRLRNDQIVTSPLYPLIEPFVNQRAFEMSFGQRRLVELARAFLATTDVLMLDEPFNFLDRQKRAILTEYLVKKSKEMTIIMTSHYLDNIPIASMKTFEFFGEAPYAKLMEVQEKTL